MKPIRAAVYGACHAPALQRLLASDPLLGRRIEFRPVEAVMTIGEAAISDLAAEAHGLDLLIYQPISADYRGPAFASARLLERLAPQACAISFAYYHFELYAPYVTAPAPAFPEPESQYADYLLGALLAHGLTDAEAADGLLEFDGFGAYAPAALAAAMDNLRVREGRVLEGDRPLDVRIADRVEQAFRRVRLGHTMNHPTAEVFAWLAEDIGRRLGERFGFNASAPAPAEPDPLDETSFICPPFAHRAFDLAFEGDERMAVRGRPVSLAAYVAEGRAYFEAIPKADFWRAVEEMAPMRPWFAPLVDRPRPAEPRAARRRRRHTIRCDEGVKPHALSQGWSVAEPAGIWTDGPEAVIELAAPEAGDADLLIRAAAIAPSQPMDAPLQVEIFLEGEAVATWQVQPNLWRNYDVVAPARLLRLGEPLRLRLAIRGAASPGPADLRLLGVAVQSLEVWA